MDACERQQYIRTAPAHSRRSESTLDRLCAIEPRAVSIDVPEELECWKAEAREFERKRRAERRRTALTVRREKPRVEAGLHESLRGSEPAAGKESLGRNCLARYRTDLNLFHRARD